MFIKFLKPNKITYNCFALIAVVYFSLVIIGAIVVANFSFPDYPATMMWGPIFWLFRYAKIAGFVVSSVGGCGFFLAICEIPNTYGWILILAGSATSVFIVYLISSIISYYYQRRKNISSK